MRKVTPFMLWEAFGNNLKEEYPTPDYELLYTQAAEKLNEILSRSSKDEQTDDLQGIPQECP